VSTIAAAKRQRRADDDGNSALRGQPQVAHCQRQSQLIVGRDQHGANHDGIIEREPQRGD